jgi:dolichyl-phosphate-mannose--protein O-mannosyl transferase
MLGSVGWWIARRDWRASLIVVGFGFGMVPWFLEPSRTKFQFYAAPILPFLVLALVGMAGLILGRRSATEERRLTGALVVGGYVLVVLGNFVWLYPILAAKVIPLTAWRARMWFPGWI